MTTLEKMFKSLTTIKGLEKIKSDIEHIATAVVHLSSAIQMQAEAIRELYAITDAIKRPAQPQTTSSALDLKLNTDKKKNVKPN
jgi:hypothetical protein